MGRSVRMGPISRLAWWWLRRRHFGSCAFCAWDGLWDVEPKHFTPLCDRHYREKIKPRRSWVER